MDVVDESSLLTDQFSKTSTGAGVIDVKTNALHAGGHSNSFIVIEGTHHGKRGLFLFRRHGAPVFKDFF